MKVSFLTTVWFGLFLTSMAGGFGCEGKVGDLPVAGSGSTTGPDGMTGHGSGPWLGLLGQ